MRERWSEEATERAAAIALCVLALGGIGLGFFEHRGFAPFGLSQTSGVVALVRTALAACLPIALIIGPGFAIAKVRPRPVGEWIGFLVLPGMILVALIGLGSWLLASQFGARAVSEIAATLTLFLVASASLRPGVVFDRHHRLALAVVSSLFIIALGRNLYSVGVGGELYGDTISRTMDARPDMRIPYHIVQLIANGINPWTDQGEYLFLPYDFSSRGPLAGLVAAPIVMLSGATVPYGWPTEPWQPFDAQGFQAYRIAVEVLTASSLLFVYGLARRLLGIRQAGFALLVIAVMPYIVHEAYFTWPKLIAAGLAFGAAHLVLRRQHFAAGMLIGLGYLAHPVALLSVPTLLLLELLLALRSRHGPWNLERMRRLAFAGMLTVVGSVVVPTVWRVLNGSHYTQSGFLTYLTGPHDWLSFRFQSLLSTLVPLWAAFTHGDDLYYVTIPGHARRLTLLYEQFSTCVPVAVGLTFTPLLALGLLVAWRRNWMLVAGMVIAPFVVFTVYWGATSSGLVREGLHAWLLVLPLVWVWARPLAARRWAWWRRWEPGLLAAQGPMSLLMIFVPSVVYFEEVWRVGFRTTDMAGILLMVSGLMWLTWRVWRESRESFAGLKVAPARTTSSTGGRQPAQTSLKDW